MVRHPNGWYGEKRRRYQTKADLIRAYARALVADGQPVTQRAVMEMLDRERPGHGTYPTEISRAIKRIPKTKRSREGFRVEVDGKEFPSIREAARAEDLSMEAARKRLANPKFPGWRRLRRPQAQPV